MRAAFFDHIAKGGEGFDSLIKDAAPLVRKVKADKADAA